MKHVKLFEEFVNESVLNEGQWPNDMKKLAKEIIKNNGKDLDEETIQEFLNNYAYFKKIEDDLSDFEYEELEEELRKLGAKFPDDFELKPKYSY